MDLTCLLRISWSPESNNNCSFNFIGFITKNQKIMTPYHEMNFSSPALHDLKTTYVLTCYTSWQNTKLIGRKKLVSTKEVFLIAVLEAYCFYISLERLSPTFIAILFPCCKLLSWNLTGYCISRNILENTVAYGLLYFEKYFAKYSLPFLLTFNRLKCNQIII